MNFKNIVLSASLIGAMFLGLNGIVIKSHGSADAIAFANAIKVGYNLATNNVNQQISANLSHYNLIEKK